MKKIVGILITFVMASWMLTGCVNFDELVQQESTENLEHTEEEIIKPEVSLGDINNDGKIEKMKLDDNVLIIYSGSRICKKVELNDEYKYIALDAMGVDIDNDIDKEIIAMLTCDTRDLFFVSDVLVFNMDSNDNYELWDFPEANESGFSNSGVYAHVSAKDEFVYSISVEDKIFDVDVSYMYDISILDKEALEKVKEQWDKMKESKYHGEVIGIYDIYMVQDSNGRNSINVSEYITDGDDKIIGCLIINITYDKNGQYSIGDIWFR